VSSPLGIVRALQAEFSEFREVRIVREGAGSLRAYCVIDSKSPVAVSRIDEWVAANHVLGTHLEIEQVTTLPMNLTDEEELLRRTDLKRIEVENADVTTSGLARALQTHFPTEVVGVSDGNSGRVVIYLAEIVSPVREQEILAAARLLMACDVQTLVASRQVAGPRILGTKPLSESVEAMAHLEADRAMLEDYLPDTLEGESLKSLQGLPAGTSTYASPFDGVKSLHQRLALFDRVYFHVPFKVEEFPAWAGVAFDEVLAALPTGRVVPVLRHTPDRYEAGLISRILEGGAPRVIFHGEAMLRAVSTFVAENPLVSKFHTGDNEARELRLALRGAQDEALKIPFSYVEAMASIASALPRLALAGPSIGMAWHPLAQWLDTFVAQRFGIPSRDLELGTAVDHRVATLSFEGAPMSQSGHYLDGYLAFVYGLHAGKCELLSVPDPTIIGRISMPNMAGVSLCEFAETFHGPAVDAMHALMTSPRVAAASSSDELLVEFEKELRQYSRRASDAYTAVCTLFTVVGLWGPIGIPAALIPLSLELARRVLGRRAPGALANIAAKITGTTREAALLARVRAL